MFGGIVEEIGILKRIYKKDGSSILEVQAQRVLEDACVGDSISVEGVCLTITEKRPQSLIFEVMPRTLKNTTLGLLKPRQRLNLERSLKVESRISGHFVLGHIDCMGVIRRKTYKGGNICLEVAIPGQFLRYCVPGGSVALDGISLTLAEIKPSGFFVFITDFTHRNTTLFFKNPGAKVNIEFDILVKAALKTKIEY